MPRPWRPDLYVVARFLDKLGDGKRWSKGKLQPAVRLNYDLFVRYVTALEDKGILQRTGEGRKETLQITEHGLQVRTRMLAWIDAVFDDW